MIDKEQNASEEEQVEEAAPASSTAIPAMQSQLSAVVQHQLEYPAKFEQLEAEYGWREKYERRRNLLRQAGLTTDINGDTIVYPSYDEERAEMLKRPELLTKMEQGFTEPMPYPVGAPLSEIVAALVEALKHYAQLGTLRSTSGDKLPFNQNLVGKIVPALQDADRDGSLVYEPIRYTQEGHAGVTKQALVERDGAFQLVLTENMLTIPKGTDAVVGGRPVLEAGFAPASYLEMLTSTKAYEQEHGYTAEALLIRTLVHLHESGGELLDSDGRQCLCTGAWLPSKNAVPSGTDNPRRLRDGVFLLGDHPDYAGVDSGTRSFVKV